MSKGPRSEHLLPAVLDHAGSSVTVSLADLQQIKQIKQSLLQRLAEQSDNPDLVKLRQATESETCFITEDGVGHIGAWTLQEQAGKPVLVRTVARNPGATVIPVATLEFVDRQWVVTHVGTRIVRGR